MDAKATNNTRLITTTDKDRGFLMSYSTPNRGLIEQVIETSLLFDLIKDEAWQSRASSLSGATFYYDL
jgi:hypothetical protein